MKTKTSFQKLTVWLLTLAMLMTFIPSFTLGVSAADSTTWDGSTVATAFADGTVYNLLQAANPEQVLGQTIGTDNYPVFFNGSNLPIPPHEHIWTYNAVDYDGDNVDDTITATCSNADNNCPNPDGGSVTIAAPDSLTYTGEVIEAKVTNTLTTGDLIDVVYTPVDKLNPEGKPIDPGTYTATIALGDAEISIDYTINAVHHIVAESSNITAGSVTGGGSYQENALVSLTATANDGYMFVGWMENGILVDNAGATYTFTATKTVSL